MPSILQTDDCGRAQSAHVRHYSYREGKCDSFLNGWSTDLEVTIVSLPLDGGIGKGDMFHQANYLYAVILL